MKFNIVLILGLMGLLALGCTKKPFIKDTIIDNKPIVVVEQPVSEPIIEPIGVIESNEFGNIGSSDPDKKLWNKIYTDCILGRSYFAFDSAVLDETARKEILKVVRYLKKHTDNNVIIEGYCDERGSEEYNLDLGNRRALSAKKYIQYCGIKGNRLETISYGKSRPVGIASNEEAWSKNRRVELKVLEDK